MGKEKTITKKIYQERLDLARKSHMKTLLHWDHTIKLWKYWSNIQWVLVGIYFILGIYFGSVFF